MPVAFRHGDPRFAFLWESAEQPPARWHGAGEGPVHYLADTPDGAWAEFLRHEEITDPADLPGIARRIWAVELPVDVTSATRVTLPAAVARGGPETYPRCQQEARRLRDRGAVALQAPSAALLPGAARGQVPRGGLREAPDADGIVWVLFGVREELRAWAALDAGSPTERALTLVAHFSDTSRAPGPERRVAVDRRSHTERRQLVDLARRERGEPERRDLWRNRRSGPDRRRP